MTVTATTDSRTIRYFGKCSTPGCKTRRIVDADPGGTIWHNGRDLDMYRPGYGWTKNQAAEHAEYATAMTALDLVCVEHQKFLRWEAGDFSYNPGKECNAKCMNAMRPSCDCSCGGDNHGGGHVISFV